MKDQEKKGNNIKVKLKDIRTGKEFYKFFETEFEKDKYIRRSKHFKNIIIIDICKDIDDN